MIPPPDEKCDPACQKIIIDTGRIMRRARDLADAAEAHLDAFYRAREAGTVTPKMKDELHAFSELNCHRAAEMLAWSEAIHRMTVKMAGGEYDGAFNNSESSPHLVPEVPDRELDSRVRRIKRPNTLQLCIYGLHNHSYLSAFNGSTRVARRAGT